MATTTDLLARSDLQRLLDFLDGAYEHAEQEDFPGWVLDRLPRLIPGHHFTWNEIEMIEPVVRVREFPELPNHAQRGAAFARYRLEHPAIVHWLTSGSREPAVMSDYISQRALRRLKLYQYVFRDLDYADQMALPLSVHGSQLLGATVARDRPGFGRRDRELARRLVPHLTRCLRVRAAVAPPDTTAHGAAGGSSSSEMAVAEANAAGSLQRASPAACSILARFFPESFGDGSDALPVPLQKALRSDSALQFCRRGERLRVLMIPSAGIPGVRRLVLVAEPDGKTDLGTLTAREREVLALLADGLTNAQIAAALAISERTAKKHLENLFRKLKVGNRTAAAAVWRNR